MQMFLANEVSKHPVCQKSSLLGNFNLPYENSYLNINETSFQSEFQLGFSTEKQESSLNCLPKKPKQKGMLRNLFKIIHKAQPKKRKSLSSFLSQTSKKKMIRKKQSRSLSQRLPEHQKFLFEKQEGFNERIELG